MSRRESGPHPFPVIEHTKSVRLCLGAVEVRAKQRDDQFGDEPLHPTLKVTATRSTRAGWSTTPATTNLAPQFNMKIASSTPFPGGSSIAVISCSSSPLDTSATITTFPSVTVRFGLALNLEFVLVLALVLALVVAVALVFFRNPDPPAAANTANFLEAVVDVFSRFAKEPGKLSGFHTHHGLV